MNMAFRNLIIRGVGLAGLLLLVVAAPAVAQDRSDGSIYSRFAVGERSDLSSSQIQALGGSSVALTNYSYVNLANPASWADQQLTRLSAGVRFQGVSIENAAGEESRLNSGNLNAFSFSFPLKAGKLGAVVAYTPYSRVAHRVQEVGVRVEDPTLISEGLYEISFQGSGGLQRAQLGLGYRPHRQLSVGGSVDFLFGILSESRVTTFNTAQFTDTRLSTRTRLSGATASLGVLGSIPQFLGGDGGISLGARVTLPVSLSGVRTQVLGQGAGQDTLGVAVRGSVDLPAEINIGLAYQLRGNWSIVLDARFEPWTNFSSELSLPGYAADGTTILKDRARYSMGVEWLRATSPLAPWGHRVAFRLGVYHDSGLIDPTQQTEFNAIGVTGGFSLPTLFPGTRIDLNLEAGRRGSTDFGLVQETYYRFYLNVNIAERWFERRKLG